MIIEQDAQETKDSFAFHANAAMRDLRLAEGTIWSAGPFTADIAEAGLLSEIQFRPGEAKAATGSVTLCIEFQYRALNGAANEVEVLKLGCRFEVEYALRDDFHPTPAQVQAFHRGNAVFNCWPFFREFVLNTTVRLAYPPSLIPFLRLVPKPTASAPIPKKRKNPSKS